MSGGAAQQAEILSSIVEEQGKGEKVIKNIIDEIQNNTKVISDIALQTNILALNSGIEASRAGDYGRGFSVVAQNIRTLSESSTQAANQITETARLAIQALQSFFDDIRAKVESIAAISEETSASAEEVAANIDHIADLSLKLLDMSKN